MEYIIKKIADISPEERKECSKLHLHRQGAMWYEFKWYEKHDDKCDVILVKDAGAMIAWALVFPDSIKKRCAYLYVHKDHRRKGIGTRLIMELQKLERKPYVAPHSFESGEFFKANRHFITIQRGDPGARWMKK